MMIDWKRNLFFVWLSQILSLAGFGSVIPFIPLYMRKHTLRPEAFTYPRCRQDPDDTAPVTGHKTPRRPLFRETAGHRPPSLPGRDMPESPARGRSPQTMKKGLPAGKPSMRSFGKRTQLRGADRRT